jgi:hypothetical protein
MISVPSVLLLSRRANAYLPMRFAQRGLRVGVRGPPMSRATENKFLIARKLKLFQSEEVLQMVTRNFLMISQQLSATDKIS